MNLLLEIAGVVLIGHLIGLGFGLGVCWLWDQARKEDDRLKREYEDGYGSEG